MKKFLTIFLSSICLFVGVIFTSCKRPNNQAIAKTYYGVVQTLEDDAGLFVYIPEVGVCDLPSYEEGKQQDITIKEGDLLRMDFDGIEVEFMERYPIGIKTPVKSMTVQMENVELEQDENDYLLTIDYTEEMERGFLAYEKGLGDTVYFTASKGVAGTGGVGGTVMVYEYCTATIENNNPKRLTLRLHLGEYTIQEFLEAFATRYIRLEAEISPNTQSLQNFFALKDELEKSDIQKIETVEYAGSVSPAERAPVEHKTSTLTEDIDTVYTWLMSLNDETLTRVTEEETLVEGGGAIYMTVYTTLGTFKLCEFGRGHLHIWNSYFEQEGRMPDIVGETVTYTFESYSNKAVLYRSLINDGVIVETINFPFGEMVCKISDKTFSSKEYRLVADIGELTVYDATHFLRNGTVYEIINDINFINYSQIIEQYFSDLENKTIFMEAYASKYGEKISIEKYYGRYESGAIVAKMNLASTDAVWSETVGEHTIMYNNGNRIEVLYNGEFHTLTEAYESGYLTENDIADIALKNEEFYPYLYNWDLIPPVYGEKIDFNVKYENTNNWNEDENYPSVKIIRSLAEFTAYCAEQGINNDSYDETYFQDKYLLVVVEETPNSAAGHIVGSVYYAGRYFVALKDNDNGDGGADVMGERHCFIELSGSVSISDEDEIIVIFL